MSRKLRKYLDLGLPLVGSFLVFTAVLTVTAPVTKVLVAALGLLLIQSGVMKLTQAIIPNERKYVALRREVDYFILLVRRLNAAALGLKQIDSVETRAAFDAIQQRMRESFDRMSQLAGKTDEEAAALNLLIAAESETMPGA
jgi:hypothetical protein